MDILPSYDTHVPIAQYYCDADQDCPDHFSASEANQIFWNPSTADWRCSVCAEEPRGICLATYLHHHCGSSALDIMNAWDVTHGRTAVLQHILRGLLEEEVEYVRYTIQKIIDSKVSKKLF